MINDQQILASLKDESTKEYAFRHLVGKYKERLYWHIKRLVIDHDDTDDILQNTFIKVWNNIETFREESELFTWLYRIATNESISYLNQKKRRSLVPLDDTNEYLINKLQSDPYFEGDKYQLLLQKAIANLPEKQRLVFNMKYFDEIRYEDISKILDVTVGALKASYHHAVKKIKEYIEQHDE